MHFVFSRSWLTRWKKNVAWHQEIEQYTLQKKYPALSIAKQENISLGFILLFFLSCRKVHEKKSRSIQKKKKLSWLQV